MGQFASQPEPPKPILQLPSRTKSTNIQQQQRPKPSTFHQQQSPFTSTNHILTQLVLKNDKVQQPKQKTKQLSKDQIITQTLCIAIEDKQYNQCWQKFIQLLQPYIKFKFVLPSNFTSLGQELFKNGCFVAYWLMILQKNKFLNFEMIFRCVQKEYLPKVNTQKNYLVNFLEVQKIRFQSHQISKSEKPKQNLKRVSFKPKTKEERKKQIQSHQGYLLDLLQINDIYLYDEVETIGIIKQIGDFIVILTKVKANQKEQTCVGIKNNRIVNSSSAQNLKKIEKDYEGIAYLDFQGMEQNPGW